MLFRSHPPRTPIFKSGKDPLMKVLDKSLQKLPILNTESPHTQMSGTFFKSSVFLILLRFAGNNNIGVVIALWAPIILVCANPALCRKKLFNQYAKFCYLHCPGLFHGHPDLVCSLLYIGWWYLWGLSPTW